VLYFSPLFCTIYKNKIKINSKIYLTAFPIEVRNKILGLNEAFDLCSFGNLFGRPSQEADLSDSHLLFFCRC
jgi:hypothetical protein